MQNTWEIKKHLENEQLKEMNIPESLFQKTYWKKIENLYNAKTWRQIARDKIKLDDKQLNKGLSKEMINPYSFTDRALQVGLNITLESHHINHANSKLIVKPNYPGFGIEVRYINKIMKELSVIYVRLINQYKFKYQTVISARFDKQDDDNQVLDETELFINLKINHNLTESDLDKTDVRSPSEHQIQQQEMKDSSWEFDKNNSMIVYIFKTGEMNGRYYVKTPLRSNAILNIENNDKFCFLGSILAYLHPFIINDPNIVAKYRQYFNELNTQDFDFTNGFKCSDVHHLHQT